ncbi:MAG: M42 family metallopeptidase [Methanomicrobiales archaeon]|jgi:endoglucanase|nr:M42 family metallopeptidase [Methanomicrobiales archaeon]
MVRDILEKLSNAHGVSGSEGSVADLVREELAAYVDEIKTDTMGNLIAVKKGDQFKVMLAAHMDEIGLMVKFIDDKGFLRFITLGGWYAPVLHSQRVILHGTKGKVTGVVGGKPMHKMEDEERKKGIKVDDMFIDIGARTSAEAGDLGIEVGTPITLDREFTRLSNGRVTGKAFDNRAGVALVIAVMKAVSSPCTVYAVFTVQEEVGLKGARTSAFSLEPDIAIATDVTIPGDHPGLEKKDANVEMGKGPVVTIADSSGRGLIANRALVAWLREVAKAADIPIQLEVGDGGTTDATAIHLTRGGVPSTTLSIPTRYIHSPVEVLDISDLEAGVRLLCEALKIPPKL